MNTQIEAIHSPTTLQPIPRPIVTSAASETAARPRSRLAGWILKLTGSIAPEQTIVVDSGGRWAMAVMDGVAFQLHGHHHDPVVIRPCAYCGTGRFESAPVTSRSDLDYALAVWQPYHAECAPVDPNDDVSW